MKDWRTFLRLFEVIRYPFRKHLIIFLLMSLMVVPPVLEAYVIQQIVDVAILQMNVEWLLWMLLAFLVISLAESGLEIIESVLSAALGPRLVFELRHKFYKHVQRLEYRFFSSTPNGEIVSRLLNDVGALENFLLRALPSMTKNALTVVVMIAVLFSFSWQISVIIMPLALCFHFLYSIKEDELEELSLKNREFTASFQRFFNENIGLAQLVKIFGLEKNRLRAHARLTKNYIRNNARFVLLYQVVDQLAESVPLTINLVIYGVGGYLVITSEISLGTLIAFRHLFGILIDPLAALFGMNMTLKSTLPSVKRIFEYMDLPLEHDGTTRLTRSVEQIEIKSVNFAYETELVVRDLDLSISRGQHIALVGPSGAGKTTLAALLLRLYPVASGEILIDGNRIEDLRSLDLRRAITLVPQDTTLFNTTIEENLRLANPNAAREDIFEAARISDIHDFILSLPDGYQTVVGERGLRLSGGQRQRLAIARALIREPDVLILDEATSHLDSESEARIQKALKTATKNLMTITIAHRLSTITACNQILVIDEGRVADRGRHEELLEKGGRYSELWNAQTRDQQEKQV